jgi:allantoicase
MSRGEGQIFDEIRGELVPAAENAHAMRWPNLADQRLGAVAIAASDEWFAPKDRLLNPAPAVFVPGKYDDHGKWMDGWESRRKRVEGHDWCVIRLGAPGIIRGVDIDTSHFTGNFPPAASIEACRLDRDPDGQTRWTELLAATGLKGNAHHLHDIASREVWTHVRLNIYPDGGVARLRVYGEVHRDWAALKRGGLVDLAAIENGGWLVGCSDQHYGSPAAILYPGIGANMGEGWETRRRREPGNEWAVFRLGAPGTIKRIVVDTTHYKGNYPDRCSIQASYMKGGDQSAVTQSLFWRVLLPEQKLEMDRAHTFEREITSLGPVTHVRFNNIPDGGVNRLRLLGIPE